MSKISDAGLTYLVPLFVVDNMSQYCTTFFTIGNQILISNTY